MNNSAQSNMNPIPAQLRRLKWNERVQRGDFVRNENREFKLWEGLSGFRADAFVTRIYRWREPLLVEAKKQS